MTGPLQVLALIVGSVIAVLALAAAFAPDPYGGERAERQLDKLLGWLRPPWHRNDDDPPQFGQGGSS